MQTENYKAIKKYDLLPRGNRHVLSSFLLSKKRTLIGRGLNCDIVIYDPKVSAIHCVIENAQDGVTIFDLNSSNGTFVNDKQVVSQRLSIGDIISFAGVEVVLKEYSEAEQPPPVLDILGPEVPPIIESRARSLSDYHAPPRPKLPEVDRATPHLPTQPVAFKRSEDEIPRIVYPLSADHRAEFSEYIFEDAHTLYPIFSYERAEVALEVIILHKDRVFSVDYIPNKNGTYFLKGKPSNSKSDLAFPYLNKSESIPFITIQNEDISVTKPPGFESFYLSDDNLKEAKSQSGFFYLRSQDILRFHKDDLQIFIRQTEAPPKVDSPPLFRRDDEFKKYLFLCFFTIAAFLGAMALYPVDEELEKEKVPEKIRSIVYKPKKIIQEQKKLTASKSPAIEKTDNTPKRVQKSPVQKVTPKEPKVVQSPKVAPVKDKRRPTPQKEVGSKEAPKKQIVKKTKEAGASRQGERAARPQPSKAPKVGAGRQQQATSQRQSAPATPSKGHVDTYRATNLKSTISSLMAKGGRTRGAKAKVAGVEGTSGTAGLSGGGDTLGSLQRAKVAKNIGSLTGATTGKIDTSKGAQGLVSKRKVYTAGIPSSTVVLGSMDPDVIRKILRDHIPQFRYCYQKELDRATNEFGGVVTLSFVIGHSGHVNKAGVKGSSNLPGQVRRCVVNVLRGIKFPEPVGGGTVEVEQPINFYPNVQ